MMKIQKKAVLHLVSQRQQISRITLLYFLLDVVALSLQWHARQASEPQSVPPR